MNSAAVVGSNSTFADVVNVFNNIFDAIVVFLIALIVVYLFWRIIATWLIGGGDPKSVAEGKQSVLVGFIVLFCIIAFWALVSLVRTTLFGG